MTSWTTNNPINPTVFTEPNRPSSAYNPPIIEQIAGPPGPPGNPGAQGPPGNTGPAGPPAGSPLTLIANTATEKPLIIRGAASQTANLQEWQNSSGTVLASVTSSGQLAVGWGSDSPSGRLTVRSTAANDIPLFIRGFSGQTGNLTEWQNSAGSILASVEKDGALTAVQALITTDAAGKLGLRVRGAASQTANLQEWQDSSGTTNARVRWDGQIGGLSGMFAGATQAANAGTIGGTFTSTSLGAVHTAIIAKGAASQTANLQEWQNSAGTTLSSFDSNGQLALHVSGVRTNSVVTYGANDSGGAGFRVLRVAN